MPTPEPVARRTGSYTSLFTLPAAEQLHAFAHMDGLYPTRVVQRGERVRELASGPALEFETVADDETHSIDGFMQRCRCTGLLILKRGQVVCERYALGHSADTRWISFSKAKLITSVLVGAAVHDGAIASLDDPVTQTVPQLRGSTYDGVTARQVLQMSFGRHVFGALGIFGQQIYVNVDEQLVIALHSAWPEPVHQPSRLESHAFFTAAALALRGG
jgi:CubicO group peptidase (beta-lactamase class C family)